VNGPIVC